jgi:hypothetical protein
MAFRTVLKIGHSIYYRFRTIRRLRTGGPTNGWALSHFSSSDSRAPGIANGLTLRSGRPWFFAKRLIESSLKPKSFAISGNCNHRLVPIFRGIIYGLYAKFFLSLDVTQIGPREVQRRFRFGPGYFTLQTPQKPRAFPRYINPRTAFVLIVNDKTLTPIGRVGR